jgi:prepilin-type N-terminal cleavage/methylation domain-containing protein
MIKLKIQSGFTLIELLIGVLLASIVTYAAMSLYITQHKQMIVQDQIADMQANTRAAAEVIANAVKRAGMNAPRSAAIRTANTNPDSITVMYDSGDLDDVQIEVTMPTTSSELRCDGHDLSGVAAEDWVYLYDPYDDTGEFLQVTHVQGSDHLQHNTMPTTRLYPAGTKVVKLIQIKFYIDQTDPDHPTLMLHTFGSQPQPFAEDIIDLNFRYFLATGAIVTQTNTPELIRMVEIDVVGRTHDPDDEFFTDYRTRNFNLRAKVRNLDI